MKATKLKQMEAEAKLLEEKQAAEERIRALENTIAQNEAER
jgi:hypothetical protein